MLNSVFLDQLLSFLWRDDVTHDVKKWIVQQTSEIAFSEKEHQEEQALYLFYMAHPEMEPDAFLKKDPHLDFIYMMDNPQVMENYIEKSIVREREQLAFQEARAYFVLVDSRGEEQEYCKVKKG